jgi:uncharacterized protein involved in exopolysaccharide biosynthesis
VGVSRYVIVRLLENFFRRWWLYLLPIVLVAGFGLYKVKGMKDSFRSGGTVNVASATLLNELSDVRGNPSYGYDTPANATRNELLALLGTDQFATTVVGAAGLDDALASGQITLDTVRSSVTAYTTGSNLMRVVAVTESPVMSERLATAAIDEFTRLVLDSEVADSTAAEAFYADLAASYEDDVQTARQGLDSYLLANPSPTPPLERPDDQLAEIARLTNVLEQAEARYTGALGKSEDARLSIEQATADVNQRLRVVDPPQQPFGPEPKRKAMVMTFATFLALGALLSIATLVIGMMLDHTVRTPADLRDRLGLRVLAVVPDAGSGGFGLRVPAPAKTKTKAKAKAKAEPARQKSPKGQRVAFAGDHDRSGA